MDGFARTTQHLGGGGSGVKISPRPFAKAVPPYTQKGTSDPISSPKAASSSNDNRKSHNLFNPRKTAAASLLPPPRPAATGICFSIDISTPFLTPSRSFNNFAAL